MTTNVKDLIPASGTIKSRMDYAGFSLMMQAMGVELRLNVMRQGWELRIQKGAWLIGDERTLDNIWAIAAKGWHFRFKGGKEGGYNFERAQFEERDWRHFCRVYVAESPEHNPLAEWIAQLPEWDGVYRLPFVLDVLFWIEAEGTNRMVAETVSAAIFVNLMRRGVSPGCEVQVMPILVSEGQGIGKSGFVKRLSPVREWYTSDVDPGMDKQDFVTQTLGKWVIEVEEMAGVKARDLEKLKGQLSRPTDRIRLPYDRLATDFPRQSTMIGTANITSKGILPVDESGYRRWGVVELLGAKLTKGEAEAYVDDNRAQLFAEALAVIREDGARLASIIEPSTEIQDAFTANAKRHTPQDHQFDDVVAWLTANIPAGERHTMMALMTKYQVHRQKELDEAVNGKPGAVSLTAETDRQRIPVRDPEVVLTGYNTNRFSDALIKQGWTRGRSDGNRLWGHQ